MRTHIHTVLALALLSGSIACHADSSYEKTSQITGGQLIATLKNFALISKQMKSMTDPTSEIVMVHGNQKATVSKDSTEIVDLDKEVVIHIDNNKKTYSQMTFADMRKMMEEMPARLAQMQQQMKDSQAKMQQQQGPAVPPNLQFNFTVTVSDPGPAKDINGKSATQQILTMKMIVTDSNNPQTSIAYTTTTEVWTTPEVPAEMQAVQDFDKRYYAKLLQGVDMSAMVAQMKAMQNGSASGMAMMFGNKPGAADAFAQMQKELAKIKGTRILEITRMGGSGTGMEAQPGTPAAGGATPPAQTPSGGSVAGQVANDTATQTASTETNKLGTVGGAFGGALLNAWNRKKAKPATPPPADTPAAASTPPSTTPDAAAPSDVTLMEMTTQTHNFSTEAIPPSVFDIPAGYKKVPSPMEQSMQK